MKNSTINISGLLQAIPFAALAGIAINVALFFIGNSTGIMDASVGIPAPDGSTQPITLLPVVISSAVPVLAAGLLLFLLDRFTANPLRIFGIIALVFLLVSLSSPFLSIPNVPMGMAIWLNLMHVVVGGSVWYFFKKYTEKN